MKCGVSSIESMAGVACRGLRCVEMTIHKCIVVFLHCLIFLCDLFLLFFGGEGGEKYGWL